jgi:hypothetical protein
MCFIKRTQDKVAFCATTVDDCFFVAANDPEWIKEQIKMLQDAYEAV